MTITIDNRLNGPVGQEVTNTTLADSADAGTVTIGAGARSDYSTVQEVLGLSTIELETGYARHSTPHLDFTPPSPSWYIRFYVNLPGLQAAGYGENEVRWLLRLDDSYALIARENVDNDVQIRLQQDDLSTSPITQDTFVGDAIAIANLVRLEIEYDGTDLYVYTYDSHSATETGMYTWNSVTLNSHNEGMELTSYRYRVGVLLQLGDNDADFAGTPVTDRQEQLLDWDPNALPEFGADGDYGTETQGAVEDFQDDYGLTIDGIIGPETGAALDLVSQEVNNDPTPPDTYLSHLAVSDSALVGPASNPSSPAEDTIVAFGDAFSEKSTSVDADGFISVDGVVNTTKQVSVTAEATISVNANATGRKEISDAVDSTVVVSSGIQSSKTGFVDAEDTVVVDADTIHETGQGIEDTVVVSGTAESAATKKSAAEDTIVVTAQAIATKSTSSLASASIGVSANVDYDAETALADIVRNGLRYRLIAYEPNGARKGQLPYPLSFQLAVPLNDMPSLTLEYSEYAARASLLNDPCEVAIEFASRTGDTYTEYPGCRFLRLRNQTNSTDRTGVVRYQMPSYAWQLRKVRNIETAEINEDGDRSFSAATPGEIIGTFLTEAQNRGNIDGLTWDFTDSTDSDGNAWNTSITIDFNVGQDLWSILDTLAQQGAFDWRINKRVLQLYNADGFLDRDCTNNVVLHRDRDVVDAPDDSSLEELAARVFVKGDQGVYYEELNPSAITPWGNWEDVINQGGISDTGTMAVLAQARLNRTENARTEMTRQIVFNTTRYLPFITYRPGDTITAPGSDGKNADLRVRQITIKSLTPSSVEGAITLNDRFIEQDLRRDRQLASITGTTGQAGGGGQQPGEDTRVPSQVQGLVLSTDTFLDEVGKAWGQITAGWTDVDTAANGTDMSISGYQVWVRHAISGETSYHFTTVDSPDTIAYMSPFEVGEMYEVRVRAVGNNNRVGIFSTTESIQIQKDAVPPPTPSDPVLSTRLGVIRVFWNGLTNSATSMPVDFDHVRVYMSDDPTGPFTHEDTLYRSGVSVIPDQPYDQLRYFYLTAVDRAENESTASNTESIATDQLVETDVSPGSIGYELLQEGAVRDDILDNDAVRNRHIAAGEITGGKIRAYSIYTDRIAVGNTKNLIADPALVSSELNSARLNVTEIEGVWSVDNNRFLLDRANNPDGTHRLFMVNNSEATTIYNVDTAIRTDADFGRIIGRIGLELTNLTSGTIQISMFAVCMDSAGTEIAVPELFSTPAYNAGGVGTFNSSNGAAIPDNTYAFVPYFRVITSGTPSNAQVFIYDTFAATTNGAVLIEDGAISATKIQANAVVADKIDAGAVNATHIQADAVQTSQLEADAITSKHTITGATIQTDAAGATGIKITTTGLFAFDGSGNQTFEIDALDGSVTGAGTFSSGITSPRVIMDANTYDGTPGIEFDTGVSLELQPTIFGESPGGSFENGSFIALSGESTINSSGRNTLILREGADGGFYLGQEYGSDEVVSISGGATTLTFNGRFTTTFGTDYTVRMGVSSDINAAGGTLNWGTSGRSVIRPVITAFDTNGKALAIDSYSASSFSWTSDSGNIFGYIFWGFRGGTDI